MHSASAPASSAPFLFSADLLLFFFWPLAIAWVRFVEGPSCPGEKAGNGAQSMVTLGHGHGTAWHHLSSCQTGDSKAYQGSFNCDTAGSSTHLNFGDFHVRPATSSSCGKLQNSSKQTPCSRRCCMPSSLKNRHHFKHLKGASSELESIAAHPTEPPNERANTFCITVPVLHFL